jgi:predicted transcriptional regulator
MPPYLSETLALFTHGRKFTALQVHDKLGMDTSRNAVNGRLEDLRDLGFLERTRPGRNFVYFRKPTKTIASEMERNHAKP